MMSGTFHFELTYRATTTTATTTATATATATATTAIAGDVWNHLENHTKKLGCGVFVWCSIDSYFAM